MSRPLQATLSVLQIDGYTWRPALASDAADLDRVASSGANRTLFQLPQSADEFAAALGEPGFRLAFTCVRGAECVGAAATGTRSQRSLNVQLRCFFSDPRAATLPLAAYVRHIFWTLPMHRVHVQLPCIDGADEYVELLKSVGFGEEGVVRAHALVAGVPRDVVVLGLLREEFEAWCLQHESRLAL